VRKIHTDLLFTNLGEPIPHGMLWLNTDGHIARVLTSEDPEYNIEDSEYFEGWLVPGFVNSHCHLELSHLQGKIQEHTGLNGFVSELMKIRSADEANRTKAIKDADAEMYASGIVAVADICNGDSTFEIKRQSEIHYHSLLERFGFNSMMAQPIFSEGQKLFESLDGLSGNICLHAPYSASTELQSLVKKHLEETASGFYSIHHAESEAEIELFRSGTGPMADRMRGWGLFSDSFPFTQMRPIDYLIPYFPENKNLLLVHNTFLNAEDLEKLKTFNGSLFLCLCLRANLYIENKVPDVYALHQSGHLITLGTDSLASNYNLKMLDEMMAVQDHFPQIPMEEIVRWSSFNGAKLFGLEQKLGQFSHGSKPGVVHIQHVDNTQKKLTLESISRLI
jgi:cytosine/adenosine deaminase-related metal-dependent hydrolase